MIYINSTQIHINWWYYHGKNKIFYVSEYIKLNLYETLYKKISI